jgi:protein transport protein SEC61 subunit alpha
VLSSPSIVLTIFRFWIVISKTTPKDYAKMIRGQELTLRNYKEKSVIRTFEEMIPIASMLGGVIIGFMTVLGDLMNVAGSSTGLMLSISILYGYYEKMSPKEEDLDEF